VQAYGSKTEEGLSPLFVPPEGALDSHRSEVEEFLMGLACPPEPILSLGGVACLGVAVEGREVAGVSEAEGADDFGGGHNKDYNVQERTERKFYFKLF
jgi:hypothetical protein